MQDSLTNCLDRRAFFESLPNTIANRAEDKLLALLIVDLDRFRAINSALGNRAGDILLQQVAERLGGMLRSSDTFARIGDDEFALLMPMMNIGHTRLAASKIESIMEEPFLVEKQEVTVKASIGIALVPQHGADADSLMQQANTALSMAKRAGSGFVIYDKEDNGTEASQFSLQADLQSAIGEGELALYYQPKINVKNGQIVAATDNEGTRRKDDGTDKHQSSGRPAVHYQTGNRVQCADFQTADRRRQ